MTDTEKRKLQEDYGCERRIYARASAVDLGYLIKCVRKVIQRNE